jgi:Glycosyltransferases, probably involved in cell wall biogenesis
MLGITLKSFIEQEYPKDLYEIIVVDNNSTDNTREIIEKWQNQSKVKLKYIFEQRQGVHYARNTAAKNALGNILYFTDDDMIATSNLLKNLINVFKKNENIGSATGRVLPKWSVTPPEWIKQLCYNANLSLNDKGHHLFVSSEDIGVFSCHQAILKEVFFQSGGFNPENTAGEWIGDGETGLNIKIKELGYNFAYVGNSIIYHMIPQARMTQEYLNKRFKNQGNCDSYTEYRQNKYNKFKLLNRIFSHFINLIKVLITTNIKKIFLKFDWRMEQAFVFYYISRIKYDYRLVMDKNWRELVLRYNWIDE